MKLNMFQESVDRVFPWRKVAVVSSVVVCEMLSVQLYEVEIFRALDLS